MNSEERTDLHDELVFRIDSGTACELIFKRIDTNDFQPNIY